MSNSELHVDIMEGSTDSQNIVKETSEMVPPAGTAEFKPNSDRPTIFPPLPNYPKMMNMLDIMVANSPFIPPLFPFPPTPIQQTPPKRQKGVNKRKNEKAIRESQKMVTGPPFVLDYAPHLRGNGYRMETPKPNGSPDVQYIPTSTAKKRKYTPKKEKHELVDKDGWAVPQTPKSSTQEKNNPLLNLLKQAQMSPGNFMNQLGIRAPLIPTPTLEMFQTPSTKGSSLPQNNPLANIPQFHLLPPHLLLNIQQGPGSPALSANQMVFLKLEANFPEWREDYVKKRVFSIHKNTLIKKRLGCMLTHPDQVANFYQIEAQFRGPKLDKIFQLFEKLADKEKEQFSSLLLLQCASFENLMREQEVTLGRDGFVKWLMEQMKIEVPDHSERKLPTFERMLDLIRTAFNFVETDDCDKYQKHRLISALQFDWSHPNENPERIKEFSRAIKLTPERVTAILVEARNMLECLININNYFWSIDSDIPDYPF